MNSMAAVVAIVTRVLLFLENHGLLKLAFRFNLPSTLLGDSDRPGAAFVQYIASKYAQFVEMLLRCMAIL